MKKIFNFTNIAPHYRKTLWLKLLNDNNNEIHFYFCERIRSGIKSIDFSSKEFIKYQNQLHSVKNFWLKGKILVWQKGVVSSCLKEDFDLVIFLGDMYCISTWIAALISRIKKKTVVFWGHGIYGNEPKLKLMLRLLFLSLANKHLLYERRAKKILKSKGFNEDNMYVIFNSLDYGTHLKFRTVIKKSKDEVYHFFANNSLPVLVFTGRLTPIKKLEMLIEAVLKLNENRTKVNLILIGDGTERSKLEIISNKGIEEKNIYFRGACYNEKEIGEYLYHADLCVSPGHVGLTAIHALSLGTPVATHKNFFNHAPEVEAITEDKNGFLFEENNTAELIQKIQKWIDTQKDREKIRRQCYEIIDLYYNPTYQLSVFNRLIDNKKPDI